MPRLLAAAAALAVLLPSAARADRLYSLMLSSFDSFDQTPAAAIEVVDLATMTTVRTLPLGPRDTQSFAVSPDEARLYVLDQAWNSRVVAVYDAAGALVASWPMPLIPQYGVPDLGRDCVLSHDGARLYVAGYFALYAFDTATGAVAATLSTGDDTPLGLALSPDGNLLGFPSTAGGSNAAAYLVDAASLSVVARIALTPTGACSYPFPNDAAFTDDGLLLTWDSNCNALSQIDIASRTFLASQTIRSPFPDEGAFVNYNNMLSYSPKSKKAYASQELDYQTTHAFHLDAFDPAAGSVSAWAYAEDGGIPFVPALSGDGSRLYVSAIHKFNGGGADTLDVIDTVSGALTRGVYTFATTFSMPWNSAYPGSARDLHVASGALTPAQAIAALIAQVSALQASGKLGAGNANALIQTLGAAQASLGRGVTTATCGQLGAAANKASAFGVTLDVQPVSTQLGCR